MASTGNKLVYSASSALACTQTSLATGSTRESAAQSNAANLFFDYQVSVTFTIASGTPSTAGAMVNVYANGSVDGTLWPIIFTSSGAVKATGAGDASIGALGTPNNLKLIGKFGIQSTTSTGERTFRTEPFSVANGFGGSLPQSFSILLENLTGVALSTSTATTTQLLNIVGVYTSSGN